MQDIGLQYGRTQDGRAQDDDVNSDTGRTQADDISSDVGRTQADDVNTDAGRTQADDIRSDAGRGRKIVRRKPDGSRTETQRTLEKVQQKKLRMMLLQSAPELRNDGGAINCSTPELYSDGGAIRRVARNNATNVELQLGALQRYNSQQRCNAQH